MSISGFFQLIIGFVLGATFFAAGVAGGLYLFFGGMSQSPPKPIFSEEKPEIVKNNKPSSNQEENVEKENKTIETEKSEPVEREKLPEGAYRARVTWADGLKLRAEPSTDAQRVGGVEYNWELIILSENGQWQKVRIPSSGQEGWIKAGNVEKIN